MKATPSSLPDTCSYYLQLWDITRICIHMYNLRDVARITRNKSLTRPPSTSIAKLISSLSELYPVSLLKLSISRCLGFTFDHFLPRPTHLFWCDLGISLCILWISTCFGYMMPLVWIGQVLVPWDVIITAGTSLTVSVKKARLHTCGRDFFWVCCSVQGQSWTLASTLHCPCFEAW